LRRLRRDLLTIALVLSLLSSFGSVSAAYDDLEEIMVVFTFVENTDPGREWTDASGFHARGITNIEQVSGAIEGDADIVINVDGTEDTAHVWVEITVRSEAGWWDGLYVQTAGPDGMVTRAILTGHGDFAGQAVLLDTVVEETETDLTLSGRRLVTTLPVEGFTLNHSLCLTGLSSIAGTTLGTGPVPGHADTSLEFMLVGLGETSALAGEAQFSDEHGSLHALWVEEVSPHGGVGKIVLLGGSGAYEHVYGVGHHRGTLIQTSGCASGIGVRAVWLGTASAG
jgi:hypothetical protein